MDEQARWLCPARAADQHSGLTIWDPPPWYAYATDQRQLGGTSFIEAAALDRVPCGTIFFTFQGDDMTGFDGEPTQMEL